MTKRINLAKFLNDRGLLAEYIEESIPSVIRRLLRKRDYFDLIDSPLCWELSPSNDLWDTVDTEWIELLDSQEPDIVVFQPEEVTTRLRRRKNGTKNYSS